MKIAVTGGSGNLGRSTLVELLNHDYTVVNLDQRESDVPIITENDRYTFMNVDIRDYEQVLAAMDGCDAVAHLAAIPSPLRLKDYTTYDINSSGTFNVLHAAGAHGIRNLALASSINAVGCLYNREPYYTYVPIDESLTCRPDEAYGLSKQVGEILADGFARRFPDMHIASLRFTYILFEGDKLSYANPENLANIFWSYVSHTDSARAVRLSLESDWTGHETFMINADDIMDYGRDTTDLLAEFFPNIKIQQEMPGRMCPVSNKKAERLLGWTTTTPTPKP
jgi:nucleoside-diphosphate-sugar epimerase